ncbi:MAG: type II toxin-antitoxin system RelE/ParE family toxin [Firmicutes bacterium]|nr:type II toxin-antitoxin system RelE/ParE family toxin [Bacillota bacterium]
MVNYKIRYSTRAKIDLANIFDYIALDNPKKAEEFTKSIEQYIIDLAHFPYIGNEDSKTKRRKLVKHPYIIYYAVMEHAQIIKIETIRHGARRPL